MISIYMHCCLIFVDLCLSVRTCAFGFYFLFLVGVGLSDAHGKIYIYDRDKIIRGSEM